MEIVGHRAIEMTMNVNGNVSGHLNWRPSGGRPMIVTSRCKRRANHRAGSDRDHDQRDRP